MTAVAVVLDDASPLERRRCDWCRGAIADDARPYQRFCSKACRQAEWRMRQQVGVAPGRHDVTAPLRLAYADPPYPRLSKRYYEDHPDYAGEVDHADLVSRLQGYDGWALSTNERSLQYVLGLCPPGVRIASWHRGERPTVSHGPLNAWEPIIYHGGRPDVAPRSSDASPGIPATRPAGETRRVDTLECFARPRLSDPDRVVGAKPYPVARFIFELLNAQPQDTLDDLYPGSGGVMRAWRSYTSQTP